MSYLVQDNFFGMLEEQQDEYNLWRAKPTVIAAGGIVTNSNLPCVQHSSRNLTQCTQEVKPRFNIAIVDKYLETSI